MGRLAGFALALTASVGCRCAGSPAVRPVEARLTPSAERLTFGETFVGYEAVRTVTLASTGTGPVRGLVLSVDGGPGFSVEDPGPRTLSPGIRWDIAVRFRPQTPGPTEGTLEASATDGSRIVIALVGTGVAPPECDDGLPCTSDEFDPATGRCVYVLHGGACDDGNACTTGDRCLDGRCLGEAIRCDDGVSCTRDFCDPDIGCVTLPDDGACDDGRPCTLDICAEAGCENPTARNGHLCGPFEMCGEVALCFSGVCLSAPVPEGSPCEDGDFCTVGDACRTGRCEGVPEEASARVVATLDLASPDWIHYWASRQADRLEPAGRFLGEHLVMGGLRLHVAQVHEGGEIELVGRSGPIPGGPLQLVPTGDPSRLVITSGEKNVLHYVDLTNPRAPTLLDTVSFGGRILTVGQVAPDLVAACVYRDGTRPLILVQFDGNAFAEPRVVDPTGCKDEWGFVHIESGHLVRGALRGNLEIVPVGPSGTGPRRRIDLRPGFEAAGVELSGWGAAWQAGFADGGSKLVLVSRNGPEHVVTFVNLADDPASISLLSYPTGDTRPLGVLDDALVLGSPEGVFTVGLDPPHGSSDPHAPPTRHPTTARMIAGGPGAIVATAVGRTAYAPVQGPFVALREPATRLSGPFTFARRGFGRVETVIRADDGYHALGTATRIGIDVADRPLPGEALRAPLEVHPFAVNGASLLESSSPRGTVMLGQGQWTGEILEVALLNPGGQPTIRTAEVRWPEGLPGAWLWGVEGCRGLAMAGSHPDNDVLVLDTCPKLGPPSPIEVVARAVGSWGAGFVHASGHATVWRQDHVELMDLRAPGAVDVVARLATPMQVDGPLSADHDGDVWVLTARSRANGYDPAEVWFLRLGAGGATLEAREPATVAGAPVGVWSTGASRRRGVPVAVALPHAYVGAQTSLWRDEGYEVWVYDVTLSPPVRTAVLPVDHALAGFSVVDRAVFAHGEGGMTLIAPPCAPAP